MANEIIQATSDVATVEPKKYNKNVGNKVIAISIKCRRIKDASKKLDFNSVKGLKYLTVISEEGVNEGKKNRWLDMHFTKDAFKNVPAECDVHSADDLTTGFLYVQAKYIQSPRTYQVKEDEETGEMIYPQIWIKGGIIGFEAYVSDQDEFDYHEFDSIDAEEVETKLIEEASDEEETTI